MFCRSRGNCVFVFQFFSRYFLEQYILDLYTIVLIKEFGLWLFSSSQRELHSVPNMNFIGQIVIYFVPVPVIMGRIMKMYSIHFNGEL